MWQWLNPLNLIKLLTLIKSLFDSVMALYKNYQDKKAEQKSAAETEKVADEAVAEVRKPLDPTKSVEERERDAEDAFDKFHNRLKRD
jgi:hypothetical protein